MPFLFPIPFLFTAIMYERIGLGKTLQVCIVNSLFLIIPRMSEVQAIFEQAYHEIEQAYGFSFNSTFWATTSLLFTIIGTSLVFLFVTLLLNAILKHRFKHLYKRLTLNSDSLR
jgi:hypothetical protein